MAITFEIVGDDLILIYEPEIANMRSFISDLSKGNTVHLRKTFNVKIDNLLEEYADKVIAYSSETKESLDFDDEFDFGVLEFRIGKVNGDYVELSQSVFDLNYRFLFSRTIPLKIRLFVADHNISIPRKMSEVFKSDIFIGGDETQAGFVSVSDYELLVKKFPTTTELKYYANSRVELLLSDYFDDKVGFLQKYQRFIKTRKSLTDSKTPLLDRDDFVSSALYESTLHEVEQFSILLEDFTKKLFSNSYPESFWQLYIKRLVFMLFPKYILAPREITFEAIDEVEDPFQRRPDFILIDTNGFVDVMDIKTPETIIISNSPAYRNNYVPSKVFSSAIQQVEKYVYCLN